VSRVINDWAEDSEDMKISTPEWEKIETIVATKIAEAIAPLRPRGWRKALSLLREWGILAANISALITLLAITLAALGVAYSHLEKETEFRTNTARTLGDIQRQLTSLNLRAAASDPSSPLSRDAVKEALANAKENDIQLPLRSIVQGGSAFIKAAMNESIAWEGAQEFLAYRSWLTLASNIISREAIAAFKPVVASGAYSIPGRPGNPEPKLYGIGAPVPIAQSARLEPIAAPRTQRTELGHEQILLVGGVASLEGMYLRHVILQDLTVSYIGGPVKLEDVSFIDCKFDFRNDEDGRKLGEEILKSSPVSINLVH